ncbi:hypothetical protein ACUNWD_19190 [Sunxiuqinia sp. A32]|uniref:hypothetical protein n=1 Tax=Sunxiuqinia sp. A32 TaxID=3461496 RepID=UPI004046359F
MISLRVDNDKKIIFANYTGSVSLSDIENFYQEISREYHHWGKLKMTQDEKGAEFINTPEILKNAKRLIDILAAAFTSIKIGVIQDRPMETAYSFLFLENSSSFNYLIKVFFLEENAYKWLEQ